MDGRPEGSPKATAKDAARRPYRTPRIARLGTLLEITAGVGRDTGTNDHSHGPLKTQ